MTLDVSKLDKFNEVNDLQLLNKLSIVVTSDVFKLDKFKEVNELQL